MDKIIALKGPDRVRKRAEIVFGSNDADGALKAVEMLIKVMAREAILGYCKKLSVTIHSDNSITVSACDRGMKLCEEILNGKPQWQNIFCELYASSRELNASDTYEIEKEQDKLYGEGDEIAKYSLDSDYTFDLPAVQYVCEYMRVESVRDGICKIVEFEKGFASSELSKNDTDEASRTTVKLKLDGEVFTDTEISQPKLTRFLQVLSTTIDGLECNVFSERDFSNIGLFYSGGIANIIDSRSQYFKKFEALGKDRYNESEYSASIKISVSFWKGEKLIECFHNFEELSSGEHIDALKKKIREQVEWALLGRYPSDSAYIKLADRLMQCLVLRVETCATRNSTKWTDGTRTAISNKMITDMALDAVSDDFSHFLKENIDRILEHSLEKAH